MTVTEFVKDARLATLIPLTLSGTLMAGGGLLGCYMMATSKSYDTLGKIMSIMLVCLSANYLFGASLLMNDMITSKDFDLEKNIFISVICAVVKPIFLPLITYPTATLGAALLCAGGSALVAVSDLETANKSFKK